MLDCAWFETDKTFIDGEWVKPLSGVRIDIENPSDGEIIGEIACGSKADIDCAVDAAKASMAGEWGCMPADERGRILLAISRSVERRLKELARLESIDVGKPLRQSMADAVALARYMEFYGGAADKISGQTLPFKHGYTVYTLREPHGVTAHIIPWNYPMQIIGRSIGAALAAGNACVLKPSEEACLTALAFADIAREAGLPHGALNVVPGLGEDAGAALAAHPSVSHISFTGSLDAGRKIQSMAAENVVPVTLELGGKSPQILFADADLDAALPFLVGAGIQNAGQTCSASSRILVEDSLFGEVLEKMACRYAELAAGPALRDLDLGPLISRRQRDVVDSYIRLGGDLEIAAKGKIAPGSPERGHYVEPTLFAETRPDHVLAQEEIFGPIQNLIPFRDEDEAVAIANGTGYGLVAGIWTRDGARQMRLARKIEAGQVYINNYGAGGGIELPFGGIGKSGHGREKGFEALYGFTRLKTVAACHV
ncbi:MAG: aldehyde dehydrogenase family protein [Albidovulum sp.]|nr:aldehyde dehydrogenase family protein [Albidovulum sp.]